MEESILNTIKKMLGIEEDYDVFDTDIIVNINSAFMVLTQIGVGPKNGYSISGESENWTSFLGDETKFEAVKTYIYLKVKTVFDPPTSSSVLESINKTISELEWRLNVNAE